MKHLFKTMALLAALLFPLVASGQKARRTAVVRANGTAQKAPESPGVQIYRSMIPTTAKLMFIDSVVVPRNQMLHAISMAKDAGSMTQRATTAKGHMLAQYENGWGDTRIYAEGDTAAVRIYQQVLLGSGWGAPARVLDEFGDDYQFQNFPFLLSDGVTLYFSAESEESMGGRDIFMTRYDSDGGNWYKPQNQGLPFNSTANDYLLAIDDVDSLGWLVTDRRQPKDSVCVYTFVPTASRKDFSEDNLTDQQLESYARIISIKDTWRFGDRQAAMKRRDAMIKRAKDARQNVQQEQAFVVTDQRVITSPEQLSTEKSRKLYAQLVEVKAMLQQTDQTIEQKRAEYVDAQPIAMTRLASDLQQLEKSREQQLLDIKNLTKRIRQEEYAANE